MFAFLLLIAPALAANPGGFGSARIVDGTPDFAGCIESEGDCQTDFYRFLSQSMLEQGFTMQHDPQLTHVAIHRRPGWTLGGQLATFPFAPPRENLSGKEENTSFSPVFPRIEAGWRSTRDGAGTRWALGGSFLPPIPVNGASALSLSTNGTAAWGEPGGQLLAIEGIFTFVRANAPIVATEDQLANAETGGYSNNLNPVDFQAACGEDVADGAAGCIDTFSLYNLAVQAGMSWKVAETLTPYAKLGLTLVNERLYVKYDDTTWAVTALQPSLHGGLGWAPGDHFFGGLGGALALRQANQSIEGTAGVFYKLVGSAGWSF